MDPYLEKIVDWIYYNVLPVIRDFFEKFFANNIFERYSPEEIQRYCIKLAIEAFIIAIAWKIGTWLAKKTRRKKSRSKSSKQRRTQTGWIWNEKECLWEPPDYIIKESNERWRYDKVKGIWIDLTKEKE